ncbi:HalOD1 output domain-containing protein [Natrinema sp. LN54]|uniref:HalOD1 output domain-containing protein n=1 Tax=Natrinema sp. LN54 TaxID=3458705 RepID=UPI004036351B
MTASLASTALESLEFDQESGTYRAQYDRDATSAGMAVIAAVSNVLGVNPVELDPLHDTVDTDALDELVRRRDTPHGSVDVSFTIEGYEITVFSNEVVTLSSPGSDRTADETVGITRR